jgi:Kef-type K+ transport system membrane component KefB
MPPAELGTICLALAIIIGSANLVGHLFVRFRQPRIVGEILAGVLFGSALLGRFVPAVGDLFGAEGSLTSAVADGDLTAAVLSFLYNLGLLMLMFVSGSAARRVLASENRRPTAWLLAVGTTFPFLLGLGLATLLPLDELGGPNGADASITLVFAIAVSVTSIPVISHIFNTLGIINTRFASVVLGVAVLEDIMLWVALAVATALAAASASGAVTDTISTHVGYTVAYLVAGIVVMPRLLRFVSSARWNVLAQASPVAWIVTVLFVYVAVAGLLDVTLVFAAFLAGFGLVGGIKGSERVRFQEPLDLVSRFSFAILIPVYTFLIGYQLDFTEQFSLPMLVAFLVGSSLIALMAVGAASRLAGFRGLDILNLAITSNARGGPGIVLASVAYEAGIINAAFFTTLVVTAIVTSQAAGWWLGYVLRKGWPLLSGSDLRRKGAAPEGALEGYEDQDSVHAGSVVVPAGNHQGPGPEGR